MGRATHKGRRCSAVRRLRAVVAVVLVAAMTAPLLSWRDESHQRPTGVVESAAAPSAAPRGSRPAEQAATTAAETPGRSLQGRDLALAWLRGYLTRSSHDDGGWETAIADLSTPDLVEKLQEDGPDSVGLHELSSWRVAAIKAYTAVDQPVNAPSRTTLSYIAVVTDGRRKVEKPFTLYAYRQSNDRWLVTLVEQPYSSEG